MVQVEKPSLEAPAAQPVTGTRPLYQVIVEDVLQKIRDGELVAGDQLGSLGDMCVHYDVSLATAHRSMSALAAMGVIKTIPRKGAYVMGVPAPPAVEESTAVRRVILVESVHQRRQPRVLHSPLGSSVSVGNFSEGSVEMIVRRCRQQHIPLEFQFIPTDASALPRVFFTPRSGDAIIAVGAGVSIALLSHLATPNVPSVLVDSVAPNAHCVLTDNHDGIWQVITHLREMGHRRVLGATCFATRVANSTNENERRDALLHHGRATGMEVAIADSGDWEELFAALAGPQPPTAIVFTRDMGAVEFIKLARERGLDVPRDVSVVGFDDWAQGSPLLQELTTVRVDVGLLGSEALDMVLNPPPMRSRLFQWRRVKPQLVVRSSVAQLHPSRSAPSGDRPVMSD